LFQIGVILHQAKSGRLIIRLSREVRPGSTVVDDKGKRLGKVMELIGPVKAPYASVNVSTSRLGKSGDPAFAE
jgi:RNA-binding protein